MHFNPSTFSPQKPDSSGTPLPENQRTKSDKKSRRIQKKFGEMTEEEVMQLKLPDHVDYNLDILVVSETVSVVCL